MARNSLLLAALAATVRSYRGGRVSSPDEDSYTPVVDSQAQAALPKIKVKAYWIRHGTSCANVLQMQADAYNYPGTSKLHGLSFTMYQDPALTDCAISRARQLGPMIWKKIMEDNEGTALDKPLVFSSELVRTMETAVHNFPEQAVYPIPYIAETGVMYDNTPRLNVDEQIADIAAPSGVTEHPLGSELAEHVMFMEGVNPESGRIVGGWYKSSYDLFLKEFPDVLGKLLSGVVKDGDTVPVIIVGHSGYMRDSLTCDFRTAEEVGAKAKKHKPKNNEVWLQEYTTALPDGGKLLTGNLPKHTVSMEPGGCQPVFPRKTFPDVPKLMCTQDIARCDKDKLPFSLLLRDVGACKSLPLCAGE